MFYKSKNLTVNQISQEKLTELLDYDTLYQIRESKMESKKLFHYNLEFFMVLFFIFVTLTTIFSITGRSKCLKIYSPNLTNVQN